MVTRRTLDVGELARRLAERRETLRLNQQQVADRAGVSRAYVSRLERGIVPNPKATELSQVAEALGMSLADLIGQAPEPVESRYPADLDEIMRRTTHLPANRRERVVRAYLASLEIAESADLARKN